MRSFLIQNYKQIDLAKSLLPRAKKMYDEGMITVRRLHSCTAKKLQEEADEARA